MSVAAAYAACTCVNVEAGNRKGGKVQMFVGINGTKGTITIPDATYMEIGTGGSNCAAQRLFISDSIKVEPNAMVAVTDAVKAALRQLRVPASEIREVFVHAAAKGGLVEGSSLGLATSVATMFAAKHRQVPERFIFTGYVSSGLGSEDVPLVHNVDHVKEKAAYAGAENMIFFLPAHQLAEVFESGITFQEDINAVTMEKFLLLLRENRVKSDEPYAVLVKTLEEISRLAGAELERL